MKPIPVTKPFLPPLEKYTEMLADIWESERLTNNGGCHQKLEQELAAYHQAPHCSLFCNGTIALQAALSVLEIKEEVITTPFSFVATADAVNMTGARPVFVDIEPANCNIDPRKVEAAVTGKTTAILPVHVYGTPCNHQALQEIADKYRLKLIYDAAHAFGVELNKEFLAGQGDVSVMSFHATKVFSTLEGGAVFTRDPEIKRRLDLFRNFGIAGETDIEMVGTNGKMNEFQAAFGLLSLKYIDDNIAERRRIAEEYRKRIAPIPGLECLPPLPGVKSNCGYFPVFIDSSSRHRNRERIYHHLKRHGIHCRRYFYPLISDIPCWAPPRSSIPSSLQVAEEIAAKVLCLPIYPGLTREEQSTIIDLLYDTK